jgi:predicted outer membrane repeat protein
MSRHRKGHARARGAAARRLSRTSSSNSRLHRPLHCERLEDRRLLAVVTVDTLDDLIDFTDGKTSLREANFATNTVPGADEIRFDPALFATGPRTILLTHGELAITDSLTIAGPGADLLTIDASGNDPTPFNSNYDGDRIFTIPGTGDQAIKTTLSGLTLTGGDPTNQLGGAIYAPSPRDSVHLHDAILRDNSAFYGGAIYGNNLELVRAQLYRNRASSGGAIIGGDFRITQSVFADNYSLTSGGAISFGGSGVVSDSEFIRNRAESSGGAISAFGNLEILGSKFRENVGVHRGGAIDASGTGELKIRYSRLENNYANEVPNNVIGVGAKTGGEGGAISAGFYNVIEIYASTIAGNVATGIGGGMDISGQRVTVESTTISGNVANRDGGGAFLRTGVFSILNSTVSGNRAGGEGGGIHVENVTLHVLHSTVTRNDANIGGGLAMGFRSTIDIDQSVLAKNAARTGIDLGREDFASRIVVAAHYTLIGSNGGNGFSEAPAGSPDANGNLIGGPIHGVIDPLLSPLADNGGPTLTHALLPGSPAIGAGDPALVPGIDGVPEFDQRGAPFTRLAGARIDIGAFESQSASGALSADFDLNAQTDGNDFLLWQRNLGKTAGATIRQGDATADGDVDANDLAVWRARFGTIAAAAANELFAYVNQPTSARADEPSGLAGIAQTVGSGAASIPTAARPRAAALAPAFRPEPRALLASEFLAIDAAWQDEDFPSITAVEPPFRVSGARAARLAAAVDEALDKALDGALSDLDGPL